MQNYKGNRLEPYCTKATSLTHALLLQYHRFVPKYTLSDYLIVKLIIIYQSSGHSAMNDESCTW